MIKNRFVWFSNFESQTVYLCDIVWIWEPNNLSLTVEFGHEIFMFFVIKFINLW